MQAIQKIAPEVFWIGGSDRRLQRFENIHPLPGGISYNSYLILDEKVALLDTVDYSVAKQFLENVDGLLGEKKIDYLILHHVEPDHSASIQTLCQKYPDMQVVLSAKALEILHQFLHFDTDPPAITVKEGDELSLGKHTLRFIMAPMVHWPEVMFSYETTQKILFSADAFGTFGALPGNLLSDKMDFEADFLDEARRYYTNIVGKYGPQVQNALKKFNDVELKMICPLHGPIWRKNLGYYLDKYQHWSTYTPEETGVLIVYGSMYGNTEQVAGLIANKLAEKGVTNIHIYDVSKTHQSYIIADIFKYSHLVLAAPTYNMGLFLPMHTLLHDMQVLNLQKRKVAIVGNGSWAPASHTIMQGMLSEMKDMELLGEPIVIRSAIKPQQKEQLEQLIDTVANSVQTSQ